MEMDDLFADEIDTTHIDLSPEDLSLRASGTGSSFGDSPQTRSATLFRPAEPRSSSASSSLRSSASRNSVKKFAELLKLTKENEETLQKIYTHTLPGEEYIGTLAAFFYACQECPGSSVAKWVPGRVIRDAFKDKVAEFLFQPDLEAFSKTVAEDHTTMMQSLEILTFDYLKGLSPEFVELHCPGDYIAHEPCIPGTSMFQFIKETLKNQRSKARSVLLTNILGEPDGSNLRVPAAKSMVLSVARVMLPYARALGDDALLKSLGREKVKWIIFMRYVTVWYHLNHTVNKKRCQWTVMDEALADLRGRPDTDRTTYFDRVLRYDRVIFDGRRSWTTIKAGHTLRTPVVERVLAPVHETNGPGGLGAGEQGTEEDDQEEN
ncbi:hypothetical protein DFH28DRAFT_997424 [Melampsora americana]|nr:hypothetical protein DFH28DRAFT_997424 [Melampsora americana]